MSAFRFRDNVNDYRTTALRRVRGTDMTSKVVVVTGASGALGKEMMFAFYQVGATVVAAGRTLSKVEAAKAEVLAREIPPKEKFGPTIPGGSIECFTCDLSSYESVDAFVKDLAAAHPSGIHVLVNNAGMIPSASGYKESKYGLETTFQANFVSTVVLTEKILPLLEKASESGFVPRIVNMSSMSHADASKPIQFGTIPSTKDTFGGYNKDYAESKWLLTAYTCELSRRYSDGKVLAVSADPGASPDSAMWDEQTAVIRFLARYVFYYLAKTSSQAAAVAAHCAVANDLKNGGYYQSGVLVPPLRKDTTDAREWTKCAEILKKVLPKDLKPLVKATE